MPLNPNALRMLLTMLAGLAICAFAPEAHAVPLVYDLTGSTITVTNTALPEPIVQPVTGSMTLDDDGLGNVSFSGDLAFQFLVEIDVGTIASGTIDTDLTVDIGGTGLRTGDVISFDNPIDYFPDGTILCQDGGGLIANVCTQGGFPDGVVVNVPEDTPEETFMRVLGDLTFGPGDATFTIANTTISDPGDSTVQYLSLQGTLIPEPSTAVLLGGGLLGLGLSRRRSASSAHR